jgi:hypothetical protein
LKERLQEGFRLASNALRLALSKAGMGGAFLDWRFRDIAQEMRQDRALFEDHLIPFLERPDFPEDLLSREGIRDLAASHRKGMKDGTHLLGCLLTLAVFLDCCSRWTRSD